MSPDHSRKYSAVQRPAAFSRARCASLPSRPSWISAEQTSLHSDWPNVFVVSMVVAIEYHNLCIAICCWGYLWFCSCCMTMPLAFQYELLESTDSVGVCIDQLWWRAQGRCKTKIAFAHFAQAKKSCATNELLSTELSDTLCASPASLW